MKKYTAEDLAKLAVDSEISFNEIAEQIKKLWDNDRHTKKLERDREDLAMALLEWMYDFGVVTNDASEQSEGLKTSILDTLKETEKAITAIIAIKDSDPEKKLEAEIKDQLKYLLDYFY